MEIKAFSGPEADKYFDDLAHLRIAVFREYPYLYEGEMAYERQYLQTFFTCPDAVLVAALDAGRSVGLSTALPLEAETENIQKPFLERGYRLSEIFYLSESVLLPEYRGQGLGKRFFEEREAFARKLGPFTHTAFCGVIRPPGHPLRPAAYQPLDGFWTKQGYRLQPGMTCEISWKEIGENAESPKKLQFWMKELG